MKQYTTTPAPTFSDVAALAHDYATAKVEQIRKACRAQLLNLWNEYGEIAEEIAGGVLVFVTGFGLVYLCALLQSCRM